MSVNDAIARGDEANQRRAWSEAEVAYAEALELDPELAHIWVQYGHSLKEQRYLERAENAYRRAIELAPEVADTHLQLGHLLKLMGRRPAAVTAYEAALSSPETHADALRELAALGVKRYLVQVADERAGTGNMDIVCVMANEVAMLRAQLDRMAACLPDITALSAWPPALYGRFRQNYCPPVPPIIQSDENMDIIMFCDDIESDLIWYQLHSLFDQSCQNFTIYPISNRQRHIDIFERMKPAFRRLKSVSSYTEDNVALCLARILEQQEQSEWIMLLASGGVADTQLTAWAALAMTLSPEMHAWIFDEELVSNWTGDNREIAPHMRQSVDYDWLLDVGAGGQTILIRRTQCLDILLRYQISSMDQFRTILLLELAQSRKAGHIPVPLIQRSSIPYSIAEHITSLEMHLKKNKLSDRVQFIQKENKTPALITWAPQHLVDNIYVVISTRDNAEDLVGMIESMRNYASRPSQLHFYIVNNGSTSENDIDVISAMSKKTYITLINIDEPFNWARINNLAVKGLDPTALIIFANDDMTMITPNWDMHIRGLLERPDVGIVGAMLLYPDNTIQHAGILLDWKGGSIHDGLYEPATSEGPIKRWQVTREASAITGAFMAMRKDLFVKVGGFDELHLPVGQSDVDICLKVRKIGKKVLWTSRVVLYHYESKSRGMDHLDPERTARSQAECVVMKKRWGKLLDVELSVNPIWVAGELPFRLMSFPSTEKILSYINQQLTIFDHER
ncbi:glycosyltransferase family protein [Novacetimonas hansenii]|uniref:Glycosyltransferase n=2 Tax=Novacetimonas hansenii TaxID=436 RepID=A0AAW5ENL3_NOVHA|nr:hypothetical protein [Novacetimonas hansenii]MCJ8352835.1 hypothetical protein [Novacetimonas hansenii]